MTRSDETAAGIDALARRARGGDGRALNSLLDRIRPLVRRWASAQLGRTDAVEDVTQAALVAVYRGLPAFRFESRLETWLYRVTRHAVLDWSRRQARGERIRERAREVIPSVQEAGSDPDGERLGEALRAVLDGLPARQREVFDLIELQGRSPAEAADLMGIAEPTARVHLMRARRAIRSRILDRHRALVEDRYGVQAVH
ncbi:MAG: sigma-70 family RNA polymerase sigma factor [Gemmatimonadetes bacterium]|nr:sigma-70 family RNA polymerase sigma factor [Gemmatimonadota bacterium]